MIEMCLASVPVVVGAAKGNWATGTDVLGVPQSGDRGGQVGAKLSLKNRRREPGEVEG